jgi:hypothetical protein
LGSASEGTSAVGTNLANVDLLRVVTRSGEKYFTVLGKSHLALGQILRKSEVSGIANWWHSDLVTVFSRKRRELTLTSL